MRRYWIWFETTDRSHEVFVERAWTRKGMVRKVARLNGKLPLGAPVRFFGKEGKR
jgi:hypothetical protein